ncbi:MAG: MFS transporter, partial [Fimbriimonadaceae bacterium]|nr:MFS transporter [Alphaproteobacteria bacterium]
VYAWLGIATAAMIPVLFFSLAHDRDHAVAAASKVPQKAEMTVRQALRTNRFRLLALMYVICGFQDFFMTTHVVAFAQDIGVNDLFAGNLLAFMGLTGLIGVFIAGAWSDRSGPVQVTVACFILRVVVFWLIMYNQQTASVALFALLFGSTFLITAPLTVIFIRDAFGLKNLGALSGLITMIHHMAGGIGAYYGAVIFDLQGNYDLAFAAMLALSAIAATVTLALSDKTRAMQLS